MTDFQSLIADISRLSAKRAPDDSVEIAALILKHGREASHHVWEYHYGTYEWQRHLEEKLRISSDEFQKAVAITEKALAEDLTEDNKRRDRLRAKNPRYYEGHPID